ncbi:hypothetical protein GOARA_067_00300 [Gordonia araii NBRC 100433]|uniref:Uncharacterized protein n=2 Tax=Gordonia araii TaxID=263909 RepID=G7H649_9ACTN|nr:hypothetical protein GOARA_067_00300 [Gordonia araii NBRC 100433]
MNTAIAQAANLAADEGGGAALDQVFAMTAATAVISVVLLWIAYRHRTYKSDWLQNWAGWLGRIGERPTWSVIPLFLFVTTILTAFLGFIWDVSLHIGRGRDDGPLANPAHYFILVGLFFLFIAGALAMILPRNDDRSVAKPGMAAVRITRDWYSPTAGILLAACGVYALVGFPLDDIWHRIFGQDVTLWGPTHLMLIGGAGFSLIAVILLMHEGYLAATRSKQRNQVPTGEPAKLFGWQIPAWISGPFMTKVAQGIACGGLLIGLSVFQVEFDFGVEQFRLVFQPMLIIAAGVFGCVVARLWAGVGATFIAVAFAALIRTIVAVFVGPILGEPTNTFPLYLAIAVVVELLALIPRLRENALAFGAVAGLAGATVGVYGESLWVGSMFVIPWPSSLWPSLLAVGIPVGVAVGLTAGLFVRALQPRPLPRPAVRRSIVVAMILVIAGSALWSLSINVPQNASATIHLTEAPKVDGFRMVTADVQIQPATLVSDDPDWVTILAWQGGGDTLRGLVIDRLEKVGPGQYRSTKPVPVDGTWKTVLRVQDGKTMTAIPVFMAADPGIGAPEVSATPHIVRPFGREIEVLQRERKFDHPDWLFSAATWLVAAMTIALVWILSWGAARINAAYFPREDQAPLKFQGKRKAAGTSEPESVDA